MPKTKSSSVSSKVVGEELRRTRLAAGLSQADVARRLNVSPPYIANIEAGRGNMTIGQLTSIASALGAGLEIRFPLVGRDKLEIRPLESGALRRAAAKSS
jgi:transcriptional regulator with XRE-family HTH domain